MLLFNRNVQIKNEIEEWVRDYIHIHLKNVALPLNIYFCLYSIVEKHNRLHHRSVRCLTIT